MSQQKRTSPKSRVSKTKLQKSKFSVKKAILLASALFVLGTVLVFASYAADPYDAGINSKIANNKEYRNLKKVKNKTWHQCQGMFEMQSDQKDAKGRKLCSHGPDIENPKILTNEAATRRKQAADKLVVQSSEATVNAVQSGKAPIAPEMIKVSEAEKTEIKTDTAKQLLDGSAPNPFQPTATQCFGNGNDGKRIAIVVAGTSSNPWTNTDNYQALRAAQVMETQLIWSSAVQNKNNIMHWRFLQNSATNCTPMVYNVNLETDGSWYDGVVNDRRMRALQSAIKNAAKSSAIHYLIFSKGDGSACGEAAFGPDGEYSNIDASAVVYLDCWPNTTPAHELLHTLGAVDNDAPHRSANGAHCWDGNDIMCYTDGTTLQEICRGSDANQSAVLHATFDCNADDYFNVKADWQATFIQPAKNGVPAKNIYNVTQSGFMEAKATSNPVATPVPATPAPTVAVSNPASKPATTPTPQPDCSQQTNGMGSRNVCVTLIQGRLKDLGYDPGAVDGIYGDKTKAAVTVFQQKSGIAQDGIVGPITWQRLFDANAARKS